MAYELRDRKNKLQVYQSNWSSSVFSSDETDSSDPEYTRRPPRRQAKNYNLRIAQVAEAGPATTSAGNVELVRPKRGRPRKNTKPRRQTRARFSYSNPAGSSNQTKNLEDSRTILSWLIDLHIVEDNAAVFYNNEIMPKGTIKRAGILCTCCEQVFTVWNFEVHAKSELRRPYEYILVESNGNSLLQCLMDAWECHIESAPQFGFHRSRPRTAAADQNDDSCMICADGGDLMCCDKCPSAFHPSCMNMERVPEGEWGCSYCVCIHCGLVRGKFLTCSVCEKKFHWSCPAPNEIDLNLSTSSFCSKSCSEIFEKLEQMVGAKNDLDNGYSWRLLKREDINLRGHTENLHKKLECNSKIAVAGVLMHHCFETIIDRFTGTNVVQSVIHSQGSNLGRLNFRSFYTAILEKDDEIISAASIRIRGREMAEMPFVGTESKCRGQGFLRKFLVAIESALHFLNVENLIIPASIEIVGMWTQKFKFSHIASAMIRTIISSNTLMFPKAVRLQKSLLADDAEADNAAMEVNEVQNNEVQQNRDKRPPFIDINLDPSEEAIDA
ncbi:hypothetical protein L3X38_027472 [Prunus dulcis]|uniref:PHD-type domain-containing protein n=1 Tax=Prunus dulcis TaxID=3755 RepID=A0AAD4VNW1_PRUDU|nr:hypothetical protein L3X38_027472 [Prunus dulcis]